MHSGYEERPHCLPSMDEVSTSYSPPSCPKGEQFQAGQLPSGCHNFTGFSIMTLVVDYTLVLATPLPLGTTYPVFVLVKRSLRRGLGVRPRHWLRLMGQQ